MLKDKILSQIQVKKSKKKYRTMNGITSEFRTDNLKQMIFEERDINNLIDKFKKSAQLLKINFNADAVRSGLQQYLNDIGFYLVGYGCTILMISLTPHL